jgi:hypothetical protein
MAFYQWSQTALTNQGGKVGGDPTINWIEGQPPPSVNDSFRQMMQGLSEYRDDIAGLPTTSDKTTPYIASTNERFTQLASPGLQQQIIGIIPNGNSVAGHTLTVDGLNPGVGATISNSPGVLVLESQLLLGAIYVVRYENSVPTFYLQNGPTDTDMVVPLGAILMYGATTLPNGQFAFCYGQEISRFDYASLFALIGTTFGVGDGDGTFNLPDLRGRAILGQTTGGTSPSGLTTTTGDATLINTVIGWTLVLPHIIRII